MRVDLRSLQPNPMRDFALDPIDPSRVEMLRQSIEEHDFWGGIVCRRLADGTIQIGAGHHRVNAALAAGITEADVFVRNGDCTDADMVRIYVQENASQRGNSGTALTGSVAAAVRIIAKAVATGYSAKIFARKGKGSSTIDAQFEQNGEVGERLVNDFLSRIVSLGDIRQGLANIRASGDYTRIMKEVEEDIEQERQEAIAKAEAAEREAERLKQEREAAEQRQRDAEAARKEAAAQKKAAKEDAEKKRAEEQEQRQEAARLKAEGEQALAEKWRKEAEEQGKIARENARKSREAQDKAAKAAHAAQEKNPDKTFDFEGVARWLNNTHQIDVFRRYVTGKALKDMLPVEKQADLAKALIEAAASQKKRVTEHYIREYIMEQVINAKQSAHQWSRKEREFLEREDIRMKALTYQEEFIRGMGYIDASGYKLAKLYQEWPATAGEFPVKPKFWISVKRARDIIDQLLEKDEPTHESEPTSRQQLR